MKRTYCLLLSILSVVFMAQAQTDPQPIKVYLSEADTTQKDITSEKLMLSTTWFTCATIDSIDKFYRIQLIRKSILGNYDNCTTASCASSDWTFKRSNDRQELQITNSMGCSESSLRTGWIHEWEWKYDQVGRVIKLYDEKGKEQFHLLISSITTDRLYLTVFKVSK